MKITRWIITALALVVAGTVHAAEQGGTATPLLQYLEQRAAALNALIERMRQTDDPAEQARLFQEHRRIMHQSMAPMRESMSPVPPASSSRGPATGGGYAACPGRQGGMMGCGYPGMMSGDQPGMGHYGRQYGMGHHGGKRMGPWAQGRTGPGMRGGARKVREQLLQEVAAMEVRISRLEEQVRRLSGGAP